MPAEGLMHRIFAGIVSAAALFAAPAAAQPSAGFAGVWQGTVGAQPVRACFNQRDSDAFGAYYYLNHLVSIPLQQPDGKKLAFVEGGDERDTASPRWTFDKAAPDRLAGSWTRAAKSLPISLTRVPLPKLKEDDTPCGSMVFQKPRVEGVRTLTKPGAKDGVHYTRLILDDRGHFGGDISVETFALAGDTPAARRINAKLREPLAGEPDGWLACVRMAANNSPYGAANAESYEPRLFSARWLVAMHHWDGDCGGAHPDSSNTPMVFDLTTGAEVNVFDWFNDQAIKREPVEGYEPLISLRPPFRSVVLGNWKADDAECTDAVRTTEYWHAELTRTGFTFTPDLPHVVQACGEDFKVPFAKVAAYLSPEGKKQIAALQAEAGSKR
jgi:hypothetical protein